MPEFPARPARLDSAGPMGYDPVVKSFTVVDLTPQCEVRSSAQYSYELLERVGGAPDLIGRIASAVWASPAGFELSLGAGSGLTLRWRETAQGAGIASLLGDGQTLSVSILCSGIDVTADQSTINAFQSHILRELHATGFEASFELLGIPDRPLLATMGLMAPSRPADRAIFALADRCFAAACLRRLGLA